VTAAADGDLSPVARENKIAVVVGPGLPAGAAANRCAVLATGLAARHPEIVGPALSTADGQVLCGFTQVPIVVLSAPDLSSLRSLEHRARELGCTTLVFLSRAQGLRSYAAYAAAVGGLASAELDVDTVLVFGPRKAVTSVTGNLPALR